MSAWFPSRARRRVWTLVTAIAVLAAGLAGLDWINIGANPLGEVAKARSVSRLLQPEVGAPPRMTRLAGHPLLAHDVKLADVTCKLPPFDTPPEPLQAYYEAAVGCMEAAWAPVFAALRVPIRPVTINGADDIPRNLCGRPSADEAAAMYCSANTTIYMPRSRVLVPGVDARYQRAMVLPILAHEYGHHIQYLSGMLRAAERAQDDAGHGSAAALETTRRVELQATCFAGLFLGDAARGGSITKSAAEEMMDTFHTTLSSETHGSRLSQADWADRGHRTNATAQCDTWTAPADDVG